MRDLFARPPAGKETERSGWSSTVGGLRSRRKTVADYRPVTRDELDELAGEALPERAAMSLINANVAVPVNAAVAANVLTDHSTADAASAPNGPITQQPNLTS